MERSSQEEETPSEAKSLSEGESSETKNAEKLEIVEKLQEKSKNTKIDEFVNQMLKNTTSDFGQPQREERLTIQQSFYSSKWKLIQKRDGFSSLLFLTPPKLPPQSNLSSPSPSLNLKLEDKLNTQLGKDINDSVSTNTNTITPQSLPTLTSPLDNYLSPLQNSSSNSTKLRSGKYRHSKTNASKINLWSVDALLHNSTKKETPQKENIRPSETKIEGEHDNQASIVAQAITDINIKATTACSESSSRKKHKRKMKMEEITNEDANSMLSNDLLNVLNCNTDDSLGESESNNCSEVCYPLKNITNTEHLYTPMYYPDLLYNYDYHFHNLKLKENYYPFHSGNTQQLHTQSHSQRNGSYSDRRQCRSNPTLPNLPPQIPHSQTHNSSSLSNISANKVNKTLKTESTSQLFNKNSHNQTHTKRTDKAKFQFPEGGWVCSLCQNYNFCGRVKCNRCGKQKTKEDYVGKPKHLMKHSSNQLNEENNSEQPPYLLNKNKSSRNASSSDLNNSSTQQTCSGSGFGNSKNGGQKNGAKKPLLERAGDWICLSCKNLNFSFRKNCNRCQLSRDVLGNALEIHQNKGVSTRNHSANPIHPVAMGQMHNSNCMPALSHYDGVPQALHMMGMAQPHFLTQNQLHHLHPQQQQQFHEQYKHALEQDNGNDAKNEAEYESNCLERQSDAAEDDFKKNEYDTQRNAAIPGSKMNSLRVNAHPFHFNRNDCPLPVFPNFQNPNKFIKKRSSARFANNLNPNHINFSHPQNIPCQFNLPPSYTYPIQ
jgi:hypothetical protein